MKKHNFAKYLRHSLGVKHVLTDKNKMEFYCRGWRSGGGDACAVVLPTTILEFWNVLKACVEFDKIIIVQAANTGLTEGSSPQQDGYDREVVVINTLKLKTFMVLEKVDQALAFPGSTLHALENKLKPLGRVPHSVIGSSCLGASIAGGVANNSGGALVKRGPAYTEYALYARINAEGQLELVDELGIENLGDTPEEILTNLESGNFSPQDVIKDQRSASDHEYDKRIRNTCSSDPARYNADPRRLNAASGCAGKVAVFALRLDTFPDSDNGEVFYIGTNDPADFTTLRRDILKGFKELPDLAEYLHKDCFNVAEVYGKDTLLLLKMLGTKHMPVIFLVKRRIERFFNKIGILPSYFLDRVLQLASALFPNILPERMLAFRDLYEHHLIVKVSGGAVSELTQYLGNQPNNTGLHFFQCSENESNLAMLHRFAAAGAALRYSLIHEDEVETVLPLDIALPRNEEHWVEQLPENVQEKILASFYYGHFLCQVFHQDYLLKKGEDAAEVKQAILDVLEARGAKYPAEHNVGHLYKAEPHMEAFYRELDPTNSFNPGIGKTSRKKNYT